MATIWILTKTGLYTLLHDLGVRGNALKNIELEKTGSMRANAMRNKMIAKGERAKEERESRERSACN